MKDFLMYALAFLITNIPAQLLNKKLKFNQKFWSKIKVKSMYKLALFIVVGSIFVGILSATISIFVPSSYDKYVTPLLLGIFMVFMPSNYVLIK